MWVIKSTQAMKAKEKKFLFENYLSFLELFFSEIIKYVFEFCSEVYVFNSVFVFVFIHVKLFYEDLRIFLFNNLNLSKKSRRKIKRSTNVPTHPLHSHNYFCPYPPSHLWIFVLVQAWANMLTANFLSEAGRLFEQ